MARIVTPLLGLAILLLAACSAEVKGPKAEITPPEIVIKSNTGSASTFCPPGQAKKGRC
jgi:outer membrane biogenesis lipoprotein LolB